MKAWDGIFRDPFDGRAEKPRRVGLTMVIDKNLGERALADLLETAHDAIDHIKFAFGTSVALDERTLRDKIALIRGYDIQVYPGGTLAEAAIVQETLPEYVRRARELGFNAVEVSDGTITMSPSQRADVIQRVLDSGLKVISEVGKKDPHRQLPIGALRAQIAQDLALGASYVIIEAREGGKGVGIYDADGAVDQTRLDTLLEGLETIDRIIWEAPQCPQQAYLIARFGANVNLGNIPPADVLSLEALRGGLRFETLKPIAAERGMVKRDEDLIARFLAAAERSVGT